MIFVGLGYATDIVILHYMSLSTLLFAGTPSTGAILQEFKVWPVVKLSSVTKVAKIQIRCHGDQSVSLERFLL